MSDHNVFSFSGRLGADAELSYFDDGNCVARFSVANSNYAGRGAGGGSNYKTVWQHCQWRSKRSEYMQHLLTRGRRVMVTGKVLSFQVEGKPEVKYFVDVQEITPLEFESPKPSAQKEVPAAASAGAADRMSPSQAPTRVAQASQSPAPAPNHNARVRPESQRAVTNGASNSSFSADSDDEEWAFRNQR